MGKGKQPGYLKQDGSMTLVENMLFFDEDVSEDSCDSARGQHHANPPKEVKSSHLLNFPELCNQKGSYCVIASGLFNRSQKFLK